MDDDPFTTDLEAAIADAGALLVRAQKYRRGAGPEGQALLARSLALGDTARRLHRRGMLDAAAAADLLRAADGLTEDVRSLLASIHNDAAYRAAVAAYLANDQTTLARTLPSIFHGLAPEPAPRHLHWPVPWRRRGRPRAAADLVAEVARLVDEGLPAEADDLSPGADPALAAVALCPDRPADEPVVLRTVAGRMPVPVYRLVDTGDYLAFVGRLRVPVDVEVAPTLDADTLDETPIDFGRWRLELVAGLAARGLFPS